MRQCLKLDTLCYSCVMTVSNSPADYLSAVISEDPCPVILLYTVLVIKRLIVLQVLNKLAASALRLQSTKELQLHMMQSTAGYLHLHSAWIV